MFGFLRNLSSSTKAIISLFLFGMLLFGLISLDDFRNIDDDISGVSLIKVQILVVTDGENGEEPVSNAEVLISGGGPPTTKFTTSRGYIEISMPPRESVEVRVSKDGYGNLIEIIDLNVDPDTNRTLKIDPLPDLSMLIDYQYYTSRNGMFPLILSSLDPDLNIPVVNKVLDHINLSELPLILKNSVFNSIEDFKFESGNGQKLEKIYGLSVQSFNDNSNKTNKSVNFVDNNRDGDILTHVSETYDLSNLLGEDYVCGFRFAPLLLSVQNTEDNIPYTSFFDFERNYGNQGTSKYGIILQFPKLSSMGDKGVPDIYCRDQSIDNWIEKVVAENPDFRNFIGFEYDFIYNPDTFEYPCGFRITRISPSPYVKFLDIVNDSNNSIKINSIDYKVVEKGNYELTIADERSSLFGLSSNYRQEINISLRPLKHLIIPIEFGFDTEPIKKKYGNNYNLNVIDVNTIYVAEASTETGYFDMSPVSFPEGFSEKSTPLPDLVKSIPQRFALGSILNIDSLTIDNVKLNIDPPSDEPTLHISNFVQGGSCPYFMVFDSDLKTWVDVDTILSVKNNKFSQTESYNIGNNISKLRIDEREEEITYISYLSFVFTDPETKKIEEKIYPLQKSDGNYLTLHQGEFLEIDLDDIIPANSINRSMEINGFYEIL